MSSSAQQLIAEAHAAANTADDALEQIQSQTTYSDSRLLLLLLQTAIDGNFNAANLYLKAMDVGSVDAETIKTLKLLYTNHTRVGRVLERRRRQQQQQSSQEVDNIQEDSTSQTSSFIGHLSADNAASYMMLASRLVATSHISQSSTNTVPNKPQRDLSTGKRVTDSPTPLLSGNDDNIQDEDDDEDIDPFERFWEVVETLVQKATSGPIAFASAPLNSDDIIALDTELPQIYEQPRLSIMPPRQLQESYFVVDPQQQAASSSRIHVTLSSSSQRTFLANNTQSSIPITKTLEEYAEENFQLKQTIDVMSRRMESLRLVQQENQTLKHSIIQFKKEFQRQAQRFNNNVSGSGRMNASSSAWMSRSAFVNSPKTTMPEKPQKD